MLRGPKGGLRRSGAEARLQWNQMLKANAEAEVRIAFLGRPQSTARPRAGEEILLNAHRSTTTKILSRAKCRSLITLLAHRDGDMDGVTETPHLSSPRAPETWLGSAPRARAVR